jgi:hypothetical protein
MKFGSEVYVINISTDCVWNIVYKLVRVTANLKHNRSLKVAVQGLVLWPTLIHTYNCEPDDCAKL